MLLNTIKQFNWVDILVIILIFRICFISYKTGFTISLFKFLGTLCALYVGMHYYAWLSDRMQRLPFAKVFPITFLDFICFVILMAAGYFLFVFLRIMVYRFMKLEAVPLLNKWGGLFFGILRAILVAGLLIYSLRICTSGYFMRNAVNSFSGPRLFEIAPRTYSWMWYNLASKFAVNEKFNSTVTEIERTFYK